MNTVTTDMVMGRVQGRAQAVGTGMPQGHFGELEDHLNTSLKGLSVLIERLRELNNRVLGGELRQGDAPREQVLPSPAHKVGSLMTQLEMLRMATGVLEHEIERAETLSPP